LNDSPQAVAPPARSRRWRIVGWSAVMLLGLAMLYVVSDFILTPFNETRLLGSRHPELIIGRDWHPRSGPILVLRDDLPSECDCPLHRMLRGESVVDVGWSRFIANGDGGLETGGRQSLQYRGRDLAPMRMIILHRKDATTLEVDLLQSWEPSWTWQRLQDRLGGIVRILIH
jgi:hypothetical protein